MGEMRRHGLTRQISFCELWFPEYMSSFQGSKDALNSHDLQYHSNAVIPFQDSYPSYSSAQPATAAMSAILKNQLDIPLLSLIFLQPQEYSVNYTYKRLLINNRQGRIPIYCSFITIKCEIQI